MESELRRSEIFWCC